MILVTGSTGFIGRYLVEELVNSQFKIRCIIRDESKISKIMGVEFIKGDITIKEDVENAIRGCSKIIHLAAVTNPYDPQIKKVNIEATRNLVHAAKKSNVEKFIFLSTANVLLPYQTAYSESKKEAEEIVRTFKDNVIIRPVVVCGKGEKKNLAVFIEGVRKMPIFFIPGSGKNVLQLIYVKDLVKAIKNSLSDKIKGTYVVASQTPIRTDDIIETIEKKLKVKRLKIHIPKNLLYPFISVYEKLFPKPLIRVAQIEYFCSNHEYDVSEAIKYLNYSPIDAKQIIEKSI